MFEVIDVSPSWRIGIEESCLFITLTAFQKCLFVANHRLYKYCLLLCLSIATTLFRTHLYFSQSLGLLLFLALLNRRLCFLIAWMTVFESHGRFFWALSTACGIHTSMTWRNLLRQFSQEVFTSPDDNKVLLSIAVSKPGRSWHRHISIFVFYFL